MDDLSYSYNKNTDGELLNNRLRKVSELATVIGGYELPAEHQNDADIYTYDAIGNLTADKSEGIDNIEWTVYGKVRSVTRTKADTIFNIAYLYDASGNRVKKTVRKTYNPSGAQVDEGLVEEATDRGVNFYVQYAFISKTGEIVFSNPEKLNNLGNELPSTNPGSIDNPANLDTERATRWARSRREKKENAKSKENPTNNSPDE
jgi:hypothetical protein